MARESSYYENCTFRDQNLANFNEDLQGNEILLPEIPRVAA